MQGDSVAGGRRDLPDRDDLLALDGLESMNFNSIKSHIYIYIYVHMYRSDRCIVRFAQ